MIVRVARSPADLAAADGLVTAMYREDGLPVPLVSGRLAVVLLALDEDGAALGTLRIVFDGEVAVAKRLAIRAKDGTATWKGLVDAALEEMLSREVQCMAATVNPTMQKRWERCLGLVEVFRGPYQAMDGAPAVVMVGSVDAMCNRWKQHQGDSCMMD